MAVAKVGTADTYMDAVEALWVEHGDKGLTVTAIGRTAKQIAHQRGGKVKGANYFLYNRPDRKGVLPLVEDMFNRAVNSLFTCVVVQQCTAVYYWKLVESRPALLRIASTGVGPMGMTSPKLNHTQACVADLVGSAERAQMLNGLIEGTAAGRVDIDPSERVAWVDTIRDAAA